MLVYLQVSTKVDLFQKITDGNVQELYCAICTDELVNEITKVSIKHYLYM